MWKYVLIISFVSGLCGLGYYIYDNTITKITTLTEQNVEYRNAANQNRKELDRILEDVKIIAEESKNVSSEFQRADIIVNKFRQLLREHNLGELAVEKPEIIEKRINSGTHELNRCFEIMSGSPLTMEEINATRPSEINNYCSDIANPNYSN